MVRAGATRRLVVFTGAVPSCWWVPSWAHLFEKMIRNQKLVSSCRTANNPTPRLATAPSAGSGGMTSRAAAQALRQLSSIACRPPSVRAAVTGVAAAGRAATGTQSSSSLSAQQTVRRLLQTGAEGVGGCGAGGFNGSRTRTTHLVRSLSSMTVGPSGTKKALSMAKTLMHDADEERGLLDGCVEDIDDT